MSGAPELNQVTGRNVPPSAAGLDLLFAALFATSFGAYAAGNLLLLNGEVLFATSMIMLPICAFWCVFYSLSRLSGNVLLGACLTLLAVWLAVRSLAYGGGLAFVMGGVAGAIHLLRSCRIPKSSWVFVAAMAVVGAAAAWSSPGAFTYFDNLDWAAGRYMHQDVAFHAAIAAMIKNYGVTSTGLHGLVETPYHVLLHNVAALVSALSGWGTLEVWGMLLYVFCLPLLMFAASYAASLMSPRESALPVIWALVCLVLASPQLVIGQLIALQFLFFSESYILSVALLLLSLPFLGKPSFSRADVALATVLTCVLAYTKGTTAIFVVGLFSARWFVLEKCKSGAGLVAALLSTIVLFCFLFVFNKASEGSHGLTTDILQIVRMGPGGAAVSQALELCRAAKPIGLSLLTRAAASTLLFFATHFALTWIVLAMLVRSRGWLSLHTDPRAVLVWGSTLGGIFFAFFFASPAGVTIWFFTSIPFFVALPVVIGRVAGLCELPQRPKAQLVGLLAILVIILGSSYHAYYRQSFLAPLRRELPKDDAFVSSMLALRRDTVSKAIMKADEKAWQIEPSYHKDQPGRWVAPFVFVALSERAWINIIRPLPPEDLYPYRDYGFAFYAIDSAKNRVTVSPAVPAGSEIRDWSPSREILEAEPKVAERIAAAWRRIFGDQ